MKKVIVLILLVVSLGVLHAQTSDTSFYTRPYYIGVSGGYTAYVQGVLSGSPVPVNPNGLPFGPTQVYWSAGYGVLWAFPFGRHMECEIGLDGNFVKGWVTEITGVHYSPTDPLRPSGYDFSTRTTRGSFISTRLQFGREIYRRNDFGIGAGLEVWTAVAAQKDVYNEIGVQLVGKMYLPVARSGAVQTSLFYGITHSGSYVGLRAAFCLKGTRVYRHKPKSYYVRTYED